MLDRLKLLSKSNLYGRFLLIILLMLMTVIIATESAYLLGNSIDGPRYGGLMVSVFYFMLMIYGLGLLRVLNYPKVLMRIAGAYAIMGLFGGFYVANPFVDVFAYDTKVWVFSFFHAFNLVIQILFSGILLKDIFSAQNTHTDHIWGAIVVYFLILMGFSEVYEIITLHGPGLLGEVYEIGFPNYIQCIMFSLNQIAGVDLLYPGAHPLLVKIGTLENVLGNLFLVVILGRLLSHPIGKNSN